MNGPFDLATDDFGLLSDPLNSVNGPIREDALGVRLIKTGLGIHKGTCRVCGCTDLHACMLDDGPCRWIAPNLCSNPLCIETSGMDFSSAAAVRASLEFKQMKEKEIAGSCGTYFADCPRCGDPLELADAEESGDYPGILICHECKDEADSDPDCILDWNYAKVLRGETEY